MHDEGTANISNEDQENYLTGYIKVFRSIRKNWIWDDPIKLKWWLDILLEVNHADRKVNIGFELIDCKRGQSVISRLEWAKRWRVDKSTIDRFFKLLIADKMIKTENLKKTLRLTVCKYDSYNDWRSAKQLANNSQTTQTQLGSGTNNNANNSNNGEMVPSQIIKTIPKQIFEVMRNQTLRSEISDERLELEAIKMAEKYPNQQVNRMASLISVWVAGIKPDVKQIRPITNSSFV